MPWWYVVVVCRAWNVVYGMSCMECRGGMYRRTAVRLYKNGNLTTTASKNFVPALIFSFVPIFRKDLGT